MQKLAKDPAITLKEIAANKEMGIQSKAALEKVVADTQKRINAIETYLNAIDLSKPLNPSVESAQ